MGQFIKLLLSSLIWTICNQEREAYTVYTTMYSVQCTLHYNVQCTVYITLQCTVYITLQFTVYLVHNNEQCTVYTVRAIYTVHYVLYKLDQNISERYYG